MLTLLLALAQDPAVHAVLPIEITAPASVTSGDLTVSQGGMTGWASAGALGGNVMVTVVNASTEPDRIVSVTSPAGPVGEILMDVVRDGQVVRLTGGDTTVPAAESGQSGRARIYGVLTDLAHGQPSNVATTITLTFEKAGEVTVAANPVSPAPPAPR